MIGINEKKRESGRFVIGVVVVPVPGFVLTNVTNFVMHVIDEEENMRLTRKKS